MAGEPRRPVDHDPAERERFTRPLTPFDHEQAPAPRPEEPPPPVGNRELVGELSRLAGAFALVVLGLLLFLSAAVCFVYG
jgi:hypothetical protein